MTREEEQRKIKKRVFGGSVRLKTQAAERRGMLMEENVRRAFEGAEMILVGLGEEFDGERELRECGQYRDGVRWLENKNLHTLLPAWKEFCAQKRGCRDTAEALEQLRELLGERNYFVVSTSTNSQIAGTEWREGRLVMPCGSSAMLQCAGGCQEVLRQPTPDIRAGLREQFEALYRCGEAGLPAESLILGCCESCGKSMVFNNVYAENYNENGYLGQWQVYRQWLQGTVNRRLITLELGVGMRFPSVIRWPFEKAAYFNRKAYFVRVNERLYQLTEELEGKGVGIAQNAIDWLRRL